MFEGCVWCCPDVRRGPVKESVARGGSLRSLLIPAPLAGLFEHASHAFQGLTPLATFFRVAVRLPPAGLYALFFTTACTTNATTIVTTQPITLNQRNAISVPNLQ